MIAKEVRTDYHPPVRCRRVGNLAEHGLGNYPDAREWYFGPDMKRDPNRHAQDLFNGIAAGYDTLAELCSFFQYGRWRRHLLSRLGPHSGDTVLDLCTGTGGVAIALARKFHGQVVGVDLSPEMLGHAQRNLQRTALTPRISLVLSRAEELPFQDHTFDAVCFTFLLRYVAEPLNALAEVVRVLKPGGRLASLEFGVPQRLVLRGMWRVYTHYVMPVLTRPISPGWRYVGGFLGPSIARFSRTHSPEKIAELWREVGVDGVEIQRLSLGSAVVMWGTRRG